MRDTLDPDWQEELIIDYYFEETQVSPHSQLSSLILPAEAMISLLLSVKSITVIELQYR